MGYIYSVEENLLYCFDIISDRTVVGTANNPCEIKFSKPFFI